MPGPPPLRQQRQSAPDRPRQGGTATQPPSKPSTPNMRRPIPPAASRSPSMADADDMAYARPARWCPRL